MCIRDSNITEENVRFMLSLIKEEFDGTKVNENVEKPSLEDDR